VLNLPPQFADRFERARTGVAYRVHGGGEPLVLFHGGAGSWNHWARNIGPLAAHFTVIAIDSPSYGDSETVARDVSDDAYLRLVVDTVTEACAGHPRFHLSGFSFGGLIAAATTAQLAKQVFSLSLIGTAGFPAPKTGTLGLESKKKLHIELGREPLVCELRAMHRRNLAKLMIWDTTKIDEQAVGMQMQNVERTRFDSRRLSWSGRLPKFLEHVRCPVKIIYGEHDISAYPSLEERKRQCREIRPDAELTVIANCGHWAMYEAPEAINRLLSEFHGGV